jgi:hypothetical protein
MGESSPHAFTEDLALEAREHGQIVEGVHATQLAGLILPS